MSAESEAVTLSILEETVRAEDYWRSADGRIGAGDVERMLGWKPGAFAQAAREGRAPPAYRIGGGGHKLTVRLVDLARWMEDLKFDGSNPV